MRCPTPTKTRYRSESAAKVALVSIVLQANLGRRPAYERRAYACPSGRHWHLTSQPSTRR